MCFVTCVCVWMRISVCALNKRKKMQNKLKAKTIIFTFYACFFVLNFILLFFVCFGCCWCWYYVCVNVSLFFTLFSFFLSFFLYMRVSFSFLLELYSYLFWFHIRFTLDTQIRVWTKSNDDFFLFVTVGIDAVILPLLFFLCFFSVSVVFFYYSLKILFKQEIEWRKCRYDISKSRHFKAAWIPLLAWMELL